MRTHRIYQVDAFAEGIFTGNPAAVVPLEAWLPDDLMQSIALENNLSETAFFVKDADNYAIRWFTPLVEVNLCGHATLASAFVIFEELGVTDNKLSFSSKSGPLHVMRNNDVLTLDFPTDQIKSVGINPEILLALGYNQCKAAYQGRDDLMYVFAAQSIIEAMEPNFNDLIPLLDRGIIVTAPGNGDIDFVSRGFFPGTGINEDPATGSAHTTLTPYWSNQLSKKKMKAVQLSQRKGYFSVESAGNRSYISGKAAMYLRGEISI